MDNKLILVDADGVLLAWDYAFDIWMKEHGYNSIPDGNKTYSIEKKYGISAEESFSLVKIFNESAAIGFLPPLRDAVQWVKLLHEKHGYKFTCITSLGTDKNAIRLRKMNLRKLFGISTWEDIICLETGGPKDEALRPYKDSGLYWVEDKILNAQVGQKLGLRSIIMEHGHNLWYKGPIPVVKNWAQIYEMIVG